MLDIKTREIIYRRVLAEYESDSSERQFGMCRWLLFFGYEFTGRVLVTWELSEQFPEWWSLRPEEKGWGVYWFGTDYSGNMQRIELLKKAIELCQSQYTQN